MAEIAEVRALAAAVLAVIAADLPIGADRAAIVAADLTAAEIVAVTAAVLT